MILKIKYIVTLFCLVGFLTYSQNVVLTNQWEEIGPFDNPIARSQTAAGLGPVEFIQISKKTPSLMIAGSLMGGLFYSENSGDTWENGGSDSWESSNCGWAVISPLDDNMWFGVSIRDGYNGGPGDIGKNGGIYRTKNKGVTWESVAKYSVFENATNTIIYGLRFHPTQPDKMYVLTSKGLFFTEDYSADYLEWTKVKYVKGSVYDLELTKKNLCFSVKYKQSWKVVVSEGQKLVPIPEITSEKREIKHITIEKSNNLFYFLIDFKTGKDEVWKYNPISKNVEVICKSASVTYGAGYTFAINPFDSNEIMIGHGLRVRKWLIAEQKFENLDNNYHVDVECVVYHPAIKNLLYIGTHGGVFKSSDSGENWQFKSYGFGNSEVLGMAVSGSDPNVIAIGLFHGGTLLRADWAKNGTYKWKQVNGGDALVPIINPNADSIVYTSNQYSGGGLFYSTDTAQHNKLLHYRKNYGTPGWSIDAKLHPKADSVLFFNFRHQEGASKGNVDVIRSVSPHITDSMEVISNFKITHNIDKYKVYGLFTSDFHPDILLAYIISKHTVKGKSKNRHRLFMLPNSLDTSAAISKQWVELELPRNDWIGDISLDPKKWFKMYITYSAGVPVKSSSPDDKGMIYHAKYKKSNYVLKRNWDISASIPSAKGGSRNLIITANKNVFVATSTGVYYGTKSTLKGGKSWQKVGNGLPNIKVSGLHYDESNQILILSYNGRGVWMYDLKGS
ncbi:MAG: hypothetical protein AB8B72_02535 [Crocinitomicaceae bacterium]